MPDSHSHSHSHSHSRSHSHSHHDRNQGPQYFPKYPAILSYQRLPEETTTPFLGQTAPQATRRASLPNRFEVATVALRLLSLLLVNPRSHQLTV